MKQTFYFLFILTLFSCNTQEDKWELVWSDEFNYTGLPDSTKWTAEVEGMDGVIMNFSSTHRDAVKMPGWKMACLPLKPVAKIMIA